MGLAVHPVGRHYVAGYDDGTVSLWDINSLEALWVGHLSHRFEGTDPRGDSREPIFKMEWILLENDDGSSTSWLLLLGGLLQSHDTVGGISVLGFDTACFHNTNMEFSTIFHNSYLYPCSQPVQDFAILPADVISMTSHSCLFIISGSSDQAVSICAFNFPPELEDDNINSKPREDTAVGLEFVAELEESEERSRNLAATLEDLESELQGEGNSVPDYVPPCPTYLPLPLCVGTTALLTVDLVSLHKAEYLRLVRKRDDQAALSNKVYLLQSTTGIRH